MLKIIWSACFYKFFIIYLHHFHSCKTVRVAYVMGTKPLKLFFRMLFFQVWVHPHVLLSWRMANQDLHMSQKKQRWIAIRLLIWPTEAHVWLHVNKSFLNLLWMLKYLVTNVNGARLYEFCFSWCITDGDDTHIFVGEFWMHFNLLYLR